MSKGNGEVTSKSTKEDKMDDSSTTTKPSNPCFCPNCSNLVAGQPETPCYKRSCPKCGTKMLGL